MCENTIGSGKNAIGGSKTLMQGVERASDLKSLPALAYQQAEP